MGAYSSRATDFGSWETLIGMGPTVWGPTVWGPTVVGLRIWDLGNHSLDWGLQSGGLQFLGNGFWISGTTYWTGGLQSGAHSQGAYSSRDTDFGSRQPLIGLGAGPTVWRPTVWGPTVWGPTVWGPTVIGQRILHLGNHSLDWGPTVWGPTVLGQRMLGLGSPDSVAVMSVLFVFAGNGFWICGTAHSF